MNYSNEQLKAEILKEVSNRRKYDKYGVCYLIGMMAGTQHIHSTVMGGDCLRADIIESFTTLINQPEKLKHLHNGTCLQHIFSKYENTKEEEVKPQVKQLCKINYEKLAALNPTVYRTHVNSLGQSIKLVEHPLKGDEAQVIAMCDELKLSAYTSFFECDDMIADHKEYEPNFKDGLFYIGDMLQD